MASEPDFAFSVSRSWSNQSAKAGHNPCVPVPKALPYMNVVPLEQEKVTFNASSLGGTSRQVSKGYKVPVGETRTFAIGFFSDGAMPKWDVRATEGNPFGTPTTKRLTVSVDKTSGENGEKAYVTVTVNSTDSKKASVLTIVSSDDSTEHYMPILISSQ